MAQADKSSLIHRLLFQEGLETKCQERYSITDEMLAHGLDPMQPERMQHSASALHNAKNDKSESEPHVEGDNDHDHSHDVGFLPESATNSHSP